MSIFRLGEKLKDTPYRLKKVIGEGGEGETFLAVDESLGRPLAIKRPHPKFAQNPKAVEKFLKTCRLAAKLKHECIVKIYHFSTALEEEPWCAMEYVEGNSLAEVLSQGGPLPQESILHLLACLCDALSLAHKENIIHGDLKPSNVMLGPHPQKGFLPKIIDFGVDAEPIDPQKPQSQLCPVGTPPYMPPEQWKGVKDARSDIYAVALVLFECLTGRLPFTPSRPSQEAWMYQHCIVEPLHLGDSFPKELDRVLQKALSKDPNARYQTLRELELDFKEALKPMTPEEAFFADLATSEPLMGSEWPEFPPPAPMNPLVYALFCLLITFALILLLEGWGSASSAQAVAWQRSPESVRLLPEGTPPAPTTAPVIKPERTQSAPSQSSARTKLSPQKAPKKGHKKP